MTVLYAPRLITFQGRTQSLTAWARERGLCLPTLIRRLRTWPLERALMTPAKPTRVDDGRRRAYQAWVKMLSRCYNQRDASYHNYGGKGIRVCKEWRESFEAFYRDMGGCPAKLTLDRRQSTGDYTKENCRWATRAEQARNRCNTRLLTLNGRTQCLKDWAQEMGVTQSALANRLNRGWSVERALTTPLYNRRLPTSFQPMSSAVC
jgi:hypothetical protein